MGSIFKKFGQGLLYILVLPIFLVAIVLFGVYGVGLFIVLMIKSIICFFKGKSLYEDLPEDIEAYKILHPESVRPKPEPIIESREEVVVIDRGSSEPTYRAVEDRPRPTPIMEPRREEIPMDRDEPEEDDVDYSSSYEDDDSLIYDEEEDTEEELEDNEDEIEEISIGELEEEEEDIPTLKEESKISVDDDFDDDDSSNGVSFTDWRK